MVITVGKRLDDKIEGNQTIPSSSNNNAYKIHKCISDITSIVSH